MDELRRMGFKDSTIQSFKWNSSDVSFKGQFRYLQPLTEEDFRRTDAAYHWRQERDIEMGFRSREDVERERTEYAMNKALIDSIRRGKIEADHEYEELVDDAICRYCEGTNEGLYWTTRIDTRVCECYPSDDEAALPSPPQTPSRSTDDQKLFDGKLDVGNRQWLKERGLMELRGPYRVQFEDYSCWREARIKFFQMSTKPVMEEIQLDQSTTTQPVMEEIQPDQSTTTHTDRDEPTKRRICGLNRWVFWEIWSLHSDSSGRLTRSQNSTEFFELDPHNHPQIIERMPPKILESGSKDGRNKRKCRSPNLSSRVSKTYKKSPDRKRLARRLRSIGSVSGLAEQHPSTLKR